MTDALASIITDLEQRKARIDLALSALREIDSDNVPDWVSSHSTPEPATESIGKPEKRVSPLKGKKLSAKTRRRMKEAQRLRHLKARGE